MSDCCARIVLLLASLVLGFVVWCAGLGADGDFRTANIAGTTASLILAIAVWRKYVRWSVLRSSSTLGIATLILAQVLLWRPLWAIGGCGLDDGLRTAQNLLTLGLGLIALALVWWGRLSARPACFSFSDNLLRRTGMTPSAVRLTMGIALIPLLAGLFFVGLYALISFAPVWPREISIGLCYEVCAVLAIVGWWGLWRPVVEWDRRRRVRTGVLAVLLAASPGVVLLHLCLPIPSVGDWWDVTCVLTPVLVYALWLAGTAWVWRSSQPLRAYVPGGGSDAVEALARCPRCDYSLKGLREVHCPECGWAATVDDVVARTLAAITAGP
jgi:hypothetical protein